MKDAQLATVSLNILMTDIDWDKTIQEILHTGDTGDTGDNIDNVDIVNNQWEDWFSVAWKQYLKSDFSLNCKKSAQIANNKK